MLMCLICGILSFVFAFWSIIVAIKAETSESFFSEKAAALGLLVMGLVFGIVSCVGFMTMAA